MTKSDDPEEIVTHQSQVPNRIRKPDISNLHPFAKLRSFSGNEEILVGSMNDRVTIAITAQGNILGLLPFTLEEANILIEGLKKSIEDIERGPGLIQ